jgi:hypothetical protein
MRLSIALERFLVADESQQISRLQGVTLYERAPRRPQIAAALVDR